MGRTRIAKATVVELEKRLEFSRKKRRELILYLYKLKERYEKKQISYARYVELVYKKTNGRTIKQWVEYYDHYISDCEARIKKQKNIILVRRIPVFFLALNSLAVALPGKLNP